MRIGLVGYGVGGRYFHAPFILAAGGCELVGVVARSAQRVADVRDDMPGMPVFGSLSESCSTQALTRSRSRPRHKPGVSSSWKRSDGAST